MKRMRALIAAGALSLLSACAFHQTPVTVMPVGPMPREAIQESNDGYLMVYSAWDTADELYTVTHHCAYIITSEDDKLVQQVKNHIDAYDEGPQRIALLPGLYHVLAKAGGGAKIIVPVVIKNHETTFVYLDGSGPNGTTKQQATNLVKLPNGDVVGWAASTHPNEK